jgi:hypothetical protein
VRVEVARRGVRASTRAGYFATPGGTPTLPAQDLPLLSALGEATPARDFPLETGVLHLGRKGSERENLILAEVQLAGLLADAGGPLPGEAPAHLRLLAHVKDAEGRVVARLTRDWPAEGSSGSEAEANAADAVLFKVSLPLSPGSYVLDTAVYDRRSRRTSVSHRPFRVPAPGRGLTLGTVCVLRRTEAATAGAAPGGAAADDPLRSGGVALFPSLATPFLAGQSADLTVYVPVYPDEAAPAVELTLELRHSNRVVAQAKEVLPAAAAGGRIPWVGTIRLAGLAPGPYELRARARQGDRSAEEHTAIEVVAPGANASPERPGP